MHISSKICTSIVKGLVVVADGWLAGIFFFFFYCFLFFYFFGNWFVGACTAPALENIFLPASKTSFYSCALFINIIWISHEQYRKYAIFLSYMENNLSKYSTYEVIYEITWKYCSGLLSNVLNCVQLITGSLKTGSVENQGVQPVRTSSIAWLNV